MEKQYPDIVLLLNSLISFRVLQKCIVGFHMNCIVVKSLNNLTVTSVHLPDANTSLERKEARLSRNCYKRNTGCRSMNRCLPNVSSASFCSFGAGSLERREVRRRGASGAGRGRFPAARAQRGNARTHLRDCSSD